MSKRGWVFNSAARFLPGLDLQQLVRELDIPIYYSGEHVRSSVARIARSRAGTAEMLSRGINVQELCKRSAMEKCLRSVCRGRQVRLHVISVGDSDVEKNSIKEVLWSPSRARLPSLEHLCKTIKFVEEPNLENLGCQLKSLISWLPEIVAHEEDFDLDLSSEDVNDL